MIIKIQNWYLVKSDPLWIVDTSISAYRDRLATCQACGAELTPTISVVNDMGEQGLSFAECRCCGFLTQTHALSSEYLSNHYNNNWRNSGQALRRRNLDEPFNTLKSFISQRTKVLDIGCGDGARLEYFKNYGCYVFGTEPSTYLANIATKRIGGIESVSGEQYLESCKDTFDIIYLHNVLQFVEEPFTLISLAMRRLEPNGVLYVKAGGLNDSNIFLIAHQALVLNYFSDCSYRTFALRNNINIYRLGNSEYILTKSTKNIVELNNNIINDSAALTSCKFNYADCSIYNTFKKVPSFAGFFYCGMPYRFVRAHVSQTHVQDQAIFQYPHSNISVFIK